MVRIIVYGTPGPQGSKSFKGISRRTGRAIMIESSRKVAPWREAVVWAAREAKAGAAPMDGPLSVSMVFTLRKPASAPKRRKTWPDKKPDLSKLVRSTEDALTDAGVIADDARIICYHTLRKVFPGEDPQALDVPGVVIEVEQLT